MSTNGASGVVRNMGVGETSSRSPEEAQVPGRLGDPKEIESGEFAQTTGESLAHVLELDTWTQGPNLADVLAHLDQEVADAARVEGELRRTLRKVLFPVIGTQPADPPQAGVYQATTAEIERVQAEVLFNGGIEGCDGTVAVFDTLPLTIIQIGVCLVSYAGEQGSWMHRLYRRDIRSRGNDPVEEALAMLERREARAGFDQSGRQDRISELARRGIMSYSERAVLLDRGRAPWRLGHGQPAPYELLTGSGSMELLHAGLDVIRRLVLDHRRFVFVPSAPAERLLLSIGNALRPLEFAVVRTAEKRMYPIIWEGNLRGEHRDAARAFYHDVAPDILVGVYRTSMSVPPQIFYAHPDHVEEAALIAMADSVLQSHRGFPILIDVADAVCRSTFGSDVFTSTIRASYAAAGSPLSYLPERRTRA